MEHVGHFVVYFCNGNFSVHDFAQEQEIRMKGALGSRDNLEPFQTPATVAKQLRDVSSATVLFSIALEAQSCLNEATRSVALAARESKTGSKCWAVG